MPSIQYYNSIVGTQVKVSGENVGIGTATPAYKLDVNGSGHFQTNISIGLAPLADNFGIEIYKNHSHIVQRLSDPTGFIINPNWYGSGEIRYANIAHYGPSYNALSAFNIGASGSVFISYEADIGIGSLSNDSLIFGTYNIERARITPAGYFGIGTDNPTNKLQIENGNVVFNDLGGTYDFRVEGDADPQLLTVKGSAGTDKVGIGCSPSLGKLHIQALYTNNNGHDAIYIDQRNTSSSNGTYNNAGIDLLSRKLVNSGVSDTGQILGVDLVAVLDGDGSLNNSYGARTWGGIYINNSGSLTNAWGIQPRVINGGYNGASIANAYGVDIVINGDLYDRIDGNTITTAMGLRIRDIEHAANKWAIYQEGVNDDNYFAGSVGVGTATPSYNLDVNGTFSANSINVNDQFTFPTTDGSGNQAIITDGSGNLSWQSVLLDNDLNASIEAGDGITLVYDSGTSVLAIGLNPTGVFDNLNIGQNTPSSSTANGTAGDISWDSNYIYVCVATNTWKRSSLSTW